MNANERMQAATRGEAGVPVYIFHTAEDDPDLFYYYDLYETETAFDSHCGSEAYMEMISSMGELAEFVEMKRLRPFGIIKSEPVRENESR